MAFHLKSSFKTCVEISKTGRLVVIAHVYHPATRLTLCDRSLDVNSMDDIHPDDITKHHKLCKICLRRLDNKPEPKRLRRELGPADIAKRIGGLADAARQIAREEAAMAKTPVTDKIQ
jgi:hypothetical protein